RTSFQIFDHRLVIARQRFQFRHEMRIRQKAYVEEQVDIERHTVFEAETDDADLGRGLRVVRGETSLEPGPDCMDSMIRSIDDDIGQGANRPELSSLFGDRFQNAPLAERVWSPRLTVATLQCTVARLH